MWPQTNKERERERKREKARRRDGKEEEGERVSGVGGFRRLRSGGGRVGTAKVVDGERETS